MCFLTLIRTVHCLSVNFTVSKFYIVFYGVPEKDIEVDIMSEEILKGASVHLKCILIQFQFQICICFMIRVL